MSASNRKRKVAVAQPQPYSVSDNKSKPGGGMLSGEWSGYGKKPDDSHSTKEKHNTSSSRRSYDLDTVRKRLDFQ